MKKQMSCMYRLNLYLFAAVLLALLIPFQGVAYSQEPTVEDSVMSKKPTSGEKKMHDGDVMSHEKMSQQDKKGHAGMMNDMQKMHKKMSGLKMTGDPDYDFASMMLEHHKGAVDMSEKQVSNGSDRQVISIAREVIDDQKKDIKELQAYIRNNKPSQRNMGQVQEETGSSGRTMMNRMDEMMKDMEQVSISGNQDQDYVSMIIMHHQQAVDMAEDYLDQGKDAKLKKMAQKMIDENKKQIGELKDIQNK